VQVIWTEKAQNDYFQNIEYVLTKWTESVALNFINEVDSIIELIKTKPEAFPDSGYDQIRRAVIRKQISLFYKVIDNNIYLLRFWNTYQNPESISF